MSAGPHPARVWLYLGAATLASGAISSLRPLYPVYLDQLGFNDDTVHTGSAALRLFSFMGGPIIGVLLDRFIGVRRGAVAGLFVMVLGCLFGVVPSSAFTVLSLVLLTVGEVFARVGLLVLLADAHPPASGGRASAFLLRHVGLNFSFIGLPMLSMGLMVTLGFWVPALIATATCGCAAALLLFSSEQEESAPEPVRTSAYGLLVFSLLGLATAAVNVTVDGFATGRIDTSTRLQMVGAEFLQLLNPVIVILLGIPVALMWVRGRAGAVGRFSAVLGGVAFIVCAAQCVLAFGSAQAGLPPGGTVATVQMMGAVVEVLAWPLSTALVTSVAPVRWRASYIGLWIALTGIPFGLSGTDKIGAGADPLVILALGAISAVIAALIFGARARIAAWVGSFARADQP